MIIKTVIMCLALFTSISGFGQTSRVHFFNPSGSITIEKNKGIYVKLQGFSLIETQQDSLSFTNEDAPISIEIERGKNYYFLVITYTKYNGSIFSKIATKVEEVSKREFFLTLLMNKHGRKPDEVFAY